MIQTFAVIGGDARQRYLAEQLMAAGFAVSCCQVPGLSDTHASLHAALKDARAIALPMPALASPTHIRTEPGNLPLASVLGSVPDGTYVFGGRLSPAAQLLAQYPVRVVDYAASEPLAIANAVPTAEGAIELALHHTSGTISGSRVLVVGFGRIGTLLALKLQALGAHVTATARNAAARARIQALGLRDDETGHYARGLYQYTCVCNTVPAPVFSAAQLRQLQPGCVFIDLASGTGALEAGTAVPGQLQYLHALALPGKCAPAAAAAAIKDEILHVLRAEQKEAL